MIKTLISNWNHRVSSLDDVYILGDFILNHTSENDALATLEILKLLNGKKHIIPGNHDEKLWKYIQDNDFPVSCANTVIENHVISYLQLGEIWPYGACLSHWRMDQWQNKGRNSLHLHGHCHSKNPVLPDIPRRVDVGVDAWNYTPVSINEIVDTVTNTCL